MDNGFTIQKTNKELYVRQFKIENWFNTVYETTDPTQNPPIWIFAECSVNTARRRDDDYYHLELYFQVGEGGYRQFMIGFFFGHKEMTKEDLDKELYEWVTDRVYNDIFPSEVSDYLTTVRLFEQYLEDLHKDDEHDS